MNLNLMKRIAKRSPHARYQHCSLIFAGSRLISYGYNRDDLHAEIVAINRMNALFRNENTRRPRNLHMVNFMIKKKTGNIGNSYPCPSCMAAMEEAGIRVLTYMAASGHFLQDGDIS